MLPNFLWLRIAAALIAAPFVYLFGTALGLSSPFLAAALLITAMNVVYVATLARWKPESFHRLNAGAVTVQTIAAGVGMGSAMELADWLGGPGNFSTALAAAAVFVTITGVSEVLLRRWLDARPAAA